MSSRGKEVSILGTLTLWKTLSLTNDTAELGSSSHFGPSQAFDSMFPGGSVGKESACNAGDLGSVPGSGRSPGEGNGNPVQYSCLERETWWATVHGIIRVGQTTFYIILSYEIVLSP